MSAKPDALATRKQLLLAQSRLQRAALWAEAAALRAGVARSPVFGLLTGTSRAAGWVGKAAGVLAVARTVMSVLRLLRR